MTSLPLSPVRVVRRLRRYVMVVLYLCGSVTTSDSIRMDQHALRRYTMTMTFVTL